MFLNKLAPSVYCSFSWFRRQWVARYNEYWFKIHEGHMSSPVDDGSITSCNNGRVPQQLDSITQCALCVWLYSSDKEGSYPRKGTGTLHTIKVDRVCSIGKNALTAIQHIDATLYRVAWNCYKKRGSSSLPSNAESTSLRIQCFMLLRTQQMGIPLDVEGKVP